MKIRTLRTCMIALLFSMAMGVVAQKLPLMPDPVTVVPYPQVVLLEMGYYDVKRTEVSLRISGMEGRTVEIMQEQLGAAFKERFGAGLVLSEEKGPGIWIGIPSMDEELMDLARKKDLVPGEELGEEGYLLKIEKKAITIVANTPAGVFYGVQSLRQIFRGNPEPLEVKAMTIRDWPSLAFRCIMDDISRGPIPTMDYMKLQVRRYAEMKINNMSFYIEHVVQTEKYPDMAPSEGGITVEEFRELSEYAADYHMELVGSFQSLGHFEKILSLPQFRAPGSHRAHAGSFESGCPDFPERHLHRDGPGLFIKILHTQPG